MCACFSLIAWLWAAPTTAAQPSFENPQDAARSLLGWLQADTWESVAASTCPSPACPSARTTPTARACTGRSRCRDSRCSRQHPARPQGGQEHPVAADRFVVGSICAWGIPDVVLVVRVAEHQPVPEQRAARAAPDAGPGRQRLTATAGATRRGPPASAPATGSSRLRKPRPGSGRACRGWQRRRSASPSRRRAGAPRA